MNVSQHSQVIGYHVCTKGIATGKIENGSFHPSRASYNWLGDGLYFFESKSRADSYAKRANEEASKEPETYVVVGAIISLERCFDLTSGNEYEIELLRNAYVELKPEIEQRKKENPKYELKNIVENGKHLQYLDCAVINYMIALLKQNQGAEKGFSYYSMRCAFDMGKPIYETAGFKEENSIQVCVKEPKCILGYFKIIPQEN